MRGSLHKRGETWTAIYDEPGEQRQQRTKGGFATRRDAQAFLTATLAKLGDGTYARPTTMTVSAYADTWLAGQGARLRPSTLESYSSVLALYVTPKLGHVPLAKLAAPALDELYAQLLRDGRADGGGLSPRTVRYTHTIVKRALADAVRKGLVARNVADLADPPSVKATKAPTMRTWTAGEVSAFLEHVRDDRLYAAWLLAASTGARRGEVLGVRWRDLDLDQGRMAIVQTIIDGPDGPRISTPKGDRGRSIALDSTTVAALRAHRRAQAAERLAWGPAYTDHGLVIAREDGTPLRPRSFSRAFERHLEAAGLPAIRLHDLRHTWATLALAAGVHPKIVSERLGHSSIAITLDVYSHVSAGMQEDAAATVAALFTTEGAS